MMKSKVLQHIIGWVLFLGYRYMTYFTREEIDFESILVIVSYDLLLIAVFYITYYYLAPWLFRSYELWKAAVVIITGIALFVLSRYLIQEVIFDLLFGFTNYFNTSFYYFVLDNLWRGFLPVLGANLIYLVERKVVNDKVQLQLRQEKTEAELANLRAQINPHFLFNTMSFLHTEAYLVSPNLAETILQFSDVLRHSVESSKEKKVSLAKEVQLIKNYLGLFEKRFADRCFVQFSSQIEQPEILIEPLLFLPFVENAFKHGQFNEANAPIRVEINQSGDKLSFLCFNSIGSKQKDPGSGIGLENVKKRLQLLYPDRHLLKIEHELDTFKVQLELKL
jgi:sensor histidine kinase YesM